MKCPKIEELHFRFKSQFFLSDSENGKNVAFQKINTWSNQKQKRNRKWNSSIFGHFKKLRKCYHMTKSFTCFSGHLMYVFAGIKFKIDHRNLLTDCSKLLTTLVLHHTKPHKIHVLDKIFLYWWIYRVTREILRPGWKYTVLAAKNTVLGIMNESSMTEDISFIIYGSLVENLQSLRNMN